MKHSRIVLLTVSVSLGMLLVILCIIAGRSTSTVAASRSNHTPDHSLQEIDLPAYQIYCTLVTTTTDSLRYSNNYTYTNAATLADYTGLALLVIDGDPGEVLPVEDDWFRLDNAEINATYTVRAIPDFTTNYNLGIIVYDFGLTPIITDTDVMDHSAWIELVADNWGPYYFRVFQISPYCTGGTYHLNFSIESPPPPLYMPICFRNG